MGTLLAGHRGLFAHSTMHEFITTVRTLEIGAQVPIIPPRDVLKNSLIAVCAQ